MPITEIVRAIAEAPGRLPGGEAVVVSLAVDTDGLFGPDRDATGRPMFWLRTTRGESLGPFEHEEEAVAAARETYGAIF